MTSASGKAGGSSQDPSAFGVGRLFWLTSEAIVAADLSTGEIVLWNPAAERLFGYSESEAIGMPLQQLMPSDLRDQHLAGVARYRAGGEAVFVGAPPIDIPAVTRDGGRLDVALSLTDVTDGPDRQHVLAVIRDVSAERRAEAELEAAMDWMGEFVAAASHDLRSPLTTVAGSTQTLLDHRDRLTDEQRDQLLEAIGRGSRQAARLVEDLLLLSQIHFGALPTHPQEVGVAQACRDAVEQSGVEATVDVDDQLVAWVDPHHLDRILINYLSNADKYGSPPIAVTAHTDGAAVAVLVTDGGSGIDAEFVAFLFTRWSRADDARPGGTGLGLSIVRGLALANGGEASYDSSAPGFAVRLPRP